MLKRGLPTTRFTSPLLLVVMLLLSGEIAVAEDGYRLWQRYAPIPEPAAVVLRGRVSAIMVPGKSAVLQAIRTESQSALSGLLKRDLVLTLTPDRDGILIIATPGTLPWIAKEFPLLQRLGHDGFEIRETRFRKYRVTVVAANTDVGALYGFFHFLRLVQTSEPSGAWRAREIPRFKLRMLNHWDNLDGTVERGYAGNSLWDWPHLPAIAGTRLRDYARANASIGINATVLNNVNANATSLTREYLLKAAAIAREMRPYGIRIFLSARFSAPMELGGLKTADPLDPQVALWWKRKADEIYMLIPDFGGFLVKANSEGQPGPRTYNRTHPDGANMLAASVLPHNGVVIWRAFVYDAKPDYDRAGAAFENLHPFDGEFASNVLLQVKNGPIDFQPREPFHPLFGAMPRTQLVPELQITQEYLGFSNHLAFLAPMWREFLDSDTYALGKGSTVTKVVDGSLYHQKLTGIAGVANTGNDRNWTGHDLAQANWYAFGRLAWNPYLKSGEIAREWISQSFSLSEAGTNTFARLLLESREAVVDYMTPLGLHHLMWGGHHYGPAPWWNTESRPDWNPTYYHRADASGLGFDRTSSGSNSLIQYRLEVRKLFEDPATCPDEYLLWFHHLPWSHPMRSGNILWDELAIHYQRGVDWVRQARRQWEQLGKQIDQERFDAVSRKLQIQERDAVRWKDASLLYFQTFSHLPFPPEVQLPEGRLEDFKKSGLDWRK